MFDNKHIILIGFKHVGKTVIGRMLGFRMGKTHLDLDHEIEHVYLEKYSERLNCREISEKNGQDFFRNLEHEVLQQVIQKPPCILSVGGGTPMYEENRRLLVPHCIVHITSSRKQVFDRIMRKGRPAFFAADKDPWAEFNCFWQQREKIYKRLASFTIANYGSMGVAMQQLMVALHKRSSG